MSSTLLDRDNLIAFLHNSVCKVVFTKADGTERTMYATLNEEHLPPRKEQDGSKPRRSRPSSNIVAWDVEAKDWRSFNIDTVTAFVTNAEPVSKS